VRAQAQRGRRGVAPDGWDADAAAARSREGTGCSHGREGLITSNFLVSDTGEVTDNHFGLIFVHERGRTERASTVG
jgi:hypothetical protein